VPGRESIKRLRRLKGEIVWNIYSGCWAALFTAQVECDSHKPRSGKLTFGGIANQRRNFAPHSTLLENVWQARANGQGGFTVQRLQPNLEGDAVVLAA
jgi:hypothetical protein